ncbi:MAG: hypothetical protein K9L85_01760 [Candidatus Peribacteraceae bacterium]|nr:hypothetical protein [Candidatus Peribacteraceae bacterium]
MSSKKKCALVVFSGGLDSQLAVKVLEAAGCEVAALTFVSPFFSSEKAERAAENLGIEIFKEDFSEKILDLVKDPPHGFGKNLNPCLDCHAAMFRQAHDFTEQNNFQIIASGEVLGQRPFSQNREALGRVAKYAGVEILRPLSAKLLPPTSFEEQGLVDREKLLDLSGRSRKPQMALAKKFGIQDYPAPAGGCLLTEPTFAQKLRTLLEHYPEAGAEDVKLLKIGRFLILGKSSFSVIGRDQTDNKLLEQLRDSQNYLVAMRDFVGPTALVRVHSPDSFKEIFPLVAEKIKSYGRDSKKATGKITFQINGAISEIREL